jgi:hypothetical protein
MAAGLILCTVSAGAIWTARPAPNAGVEAARDLAAAPSPVAAVPVRGGVLPTAREPLPPQRLVIPSLRVTARVVPVGVAGGDLEVPADPLTAGWYRFGPGLDEAAGSMVIAGHVDTRERGTGAFFRLRDLTPGARIDLTGPGGGIRTYRVVAREANPKSAAPLGRYFARDGAPRLTLITCGGPFDTRIGRYRDNLVITAEPSGSS